MRVRTRRVTGWPTASHIRRTWRLRPSWIAMRSTPGDGCDTVGRGGQAVVELDALAQAADRAGAHAAGPVDHLGEVLLVDAVARVGDAVGQLAVVGEQQQALGVGVEAARPGRPAGRPARASTTVRRPCGSLAVVTTPAGLLSR